ncbi:hypothetical protein [Altibacter sp.]|uniref:hypothetical protein n=1 Tax=Altibacter sp. TaxID=2024823 RepID=UPI0025B9D236|nr:hypothetical protein [Altibacter sp.]|tara:strand:- start:39 stop:653 length:615 start_codon:yes stop_codon:yes gene_type:complete
MRKAVFFVAVFLMGSTTQIFAQKNHRYEVQKGKKHRYYNAQEIRFVENGVLFTVTTDGAFYYEFTGESPVSMRPRRGHQVVYYNNAPGEVYHRTGRYNFRNAITTDRFDRVRSIGDTYIYYQRNGKVRSIGSIDLIYHRGRLVQAGNMTLIYDRFGRIRDLKGYVNRYNKKLWHDGWYNYNNNGYDCEDGYEDWNDRERKRKKN